MIKKEQIVNILVEYGLSPIEAERVLDSEENFKDALNYLLWENQ